MKHTPKLVTKKALRNMVAYAILISITLALSVLVYGWLKFYVSGTDVDTCPENVNLAIKDASCKYGVGTSGNFELTVRNNGLFNVSGYVLRVHERDDADFGFYMVNDTGVPLAPGEEDFVSYTYNQISDFPNEDHITLIEVQPFIVENGQLICKSYTTQKVTCTA